MLKSVAQAQSLLGVHVAAYNFFNLGRHPMVAETYQHFRLRASVSWQSAVAM